MIDRPQRVASPESIDIKAPGLAGTLSTIITIYKLTRPDPHAAIILKLDDISRDVKNTYNVMATALAEGKLADAQGIILDCLAKVQGELKEPKEWPSAGGRSSFAQATLSGHFEVLNAAVVASTTAVISLLGHYEGTQANTSQPLKQYIGGYCAYIAQYLGNLSAAFQAYRIYLDSDAANWESLNEIDKEMSRTYAGWQLGLNEALDTLCKSIVPNSNPKCYKPIFEDREFNLKWSSDRNVHMDSHKSRVYTACDEKGRSGAAFKAKLSYPTESYPWVLDIDGKSAIVISNSTDELPRGYGGEPLWTACSNGKKPQGIFQLEHTYGGLRVSTPLYPGMHMDQAQRGGWGDRHTIGWSKGNHDRTCWQVAEPLH